MTLFKLPIFHFSRKSTPIVATNTSLDAWCQQLHTDPTRLVHKVEICTALTAGNDAWGMPIDEIHYHTLLRVHLSDDDSNPSDNVLLIERILSTCGEYHSVTPIPKTFSSCCGTLFHPDVHDRICITSERSSTVLARELEIERTLVFGESPGGCLTVSQLAQVFGFVSQVTLLVSTGGNCKLQSRLFAFTCMAALSPYLPPTMLEKKSGRGRGVNTRYGANMANDLMFELSAENFLCRVPYLVDPDDAESMQALRLVASLRDDPMRA